MPVLKKNLLAKMKELEYMDRKVTNAFLDWWNDDTISFTLEECNAKLKELVKEYTPKLSHISRILSRIQVKQFTILSEWYKRHVTGHDANFTYLYSLAYRDTAYPNVQKRLVDLITEWKDDVDSRPKPSPLAAIAMDRQSIHTAPVMKQQNTTREILYAIPIPKDQKTIDEITGALLEHYGWNETVEKVVNDMVLWGKKSHISEDGDYMYRRILRHLWAKIKLCKGEEYSSLLERLYEECVESLGMCAMGHVNRLCNVLCGFVDGVEAPRDSKEAFQDLIAKLAAEEKDLEEKKKEAVVLMDTYSIATEEREAWLDALRF